MSPAICHPEDSSLYLIAIPATHWVFSFFVWKLFLEIPSYHFRRGDSCLPRVIFWFTVTRELLSQMLWAKACSQSWKCGALDMMLLVPERGCWTPWWDIRMNPLEKPNNFQHHNENSTKEQWLHWFCRCTGEAGGSWAAPWVLVVATLLVSGLRWMNLHFWCIALLVSGWMHGIRLQKML